MFDDLLDDAEDLEVYADTDKTTSITDKSEKGKRGQVQDTAKDVSILKPLKKRKKKKSDSRFRISGPGIKQRGYSSKDEAGKSLIDELTD